MRQSVENLMTKELNPGGPPMTEQHALNVLLYQLMTSCYLIAPEEVLYVNPRELFSAKRADIEGELRFVSQRPKVKS